ncbi:NO-inducible flavohemoprotein [Cyclobacterium qasimii]|uniref:Flavohemoprotein n=1 Tax=Cyclobacterium qasimii TaxID=1350429 RepID=A0A512CHG4_9BACT|nr:NO-inducible flavohemoprotein [Cyclobacterium qasimii]GEO23651.1 nitric oxide dioxygenase [Cyclobacterium qasimii]
MNNSQREIITATVPILREHGVALTTHFYKRMFSHHPDLKNIFNMGNQKTGKQQQALAMAVLAYAEHIANPGVLLPELHRIGHKHVSLEIRPEHYPIVGNHLIASIKEVLGEAASLEILEAWEIAYNQLADLMMGIEAGIYKDQTNKKGGWTGWRPFRVKEKVKESDEITSFYLYPCDGENVISHIPGQFISLRVFLPDLGLNQARQYSVSSVPNEHYYRISVKKEFNPNLNINGMISNFLHDHIQTGDLVDLTAPIGNFTLEPKKGVPITFISGGVGVTPLISMLQSLSFDKPSQPLTWVHPCRNQTVHAFKEDVKSMAENNPDLSQHIFYDALTEKDEKDGVLQGPLDLNKIEAFPKESQYYICGPAGFIAQQHKELIAKGVPGDAISFEEFGPQLLNLN